jgi:hypothetical protein
MRSVLAVYISIALAACAEGSEQSASENGFAGSDQSGAADPLAARLATSDPSICTDEAVQSSVVLQTLRGLDPQSAEKYQLLLSSGGNLGFAAARMTGAQPKISEVTCSASLQTGIEEQAVPFTYKVRPGLEPGDVIVDETGKVERWFHFRGAIVSQLAERGLLQAPAVADPQPGSQPQAIEEPPPADPRWQEPELPPMNDEAPDSEPAAPARSEIEEVGADAGAPEGRP